jgi:uncharacterized protein
METTTIDLEQLGLRSGEASVFEIELTPVAPAVGGVSYPIEGGAVGARVEASRTTSGFALRLRAGVELLGPCARCLEQTSLNVPIEAREVDQRSAGDAELRSPYVDDGLLDVGAWLHDAITLALPAKVLCRPDCQGICEICGVSLNDPGETEHAHERPLDPRFAKLRELTDGD